MGKKQEKAKTDSMQKNKQKTKDKTNKQALSQ